MEDVIAAVGMSKGGVYRHYGSTAEMLYDLMVDGNQNRHAVMENFMAHNEGLSPVDTAVEMILLKIIDQNDYKSLYAMFLIEAEKNPKLKKLRDEMIATSKKDYHEFVKGRNLEELVCLINDEWTALINALIVANEILDVRQTFVEHKDFLRSIIRNYIQSADK